MPAGNALGYLKAAGAGAYEYGGAIVAGGGSWAVDATTDINPLLAITPSPWVAPIYGFATFNPMEMGRRLSMAVTGRGSFQYDGAWGYKTLMTGTTGSIWSNLSLGNLVLSGVEATGKGLGSAFGLEKDPTIKMMSQARTKGLAGMFGQVDNVAGGGAHYSKVLSQEEITAIRDKMRHRWRGRKHISG